MIRPRLKYFAVVLIVVAAFLAGTSESQAGWWRHCGNWGWGWGHSYYGGWHAPCYTTYYPCRTTWYGCGYYSWVYPGWGGCGYHYPYYGCYDVCGCYGVGFYPGVALPVAGAAVEAAETAKPAPEPEDDEAELPAPSAPSAPPAAAPAPVPETPTTPAAPGSGTSTDYFPNRSTSGLLTVWVPADAKVIINGLETNSTGSKREYVSYGLTPGFSYKYVIQAKIVRDGKVVRETKEVKLTAGAKDGVAFGFNAQPTEQVAQRF